MTVRSGGRVDIGIEALGGLVHLFFLSLRDKMVGIVAADRICRAERGQKQDQRKDKTSRPSLPWRAVAERCHCIRRIVQANVGSTHTTLVQSIPEGSERSIQVWACHAPEGTNRALSPATHVDGRVYPLAPKGRMQRYRLGASMHLNLQGCSDRFGAVWKPESNN